jgi:hypothetical protein
VEEQRRKKRPEQLAPERQRTIRLDDIERPENTKRDPCRAWPTTALPWMCFRFDTTYLLSLGDCCRD